MSDELKDLSELTNDIREVNRDRVNGFTAKVYDNTRGQWTPIYVPPLGTDREAGIVYLTDEVNVGNSGGNGDSPGGDGGNNNSDAESGSTAVTPKGLENLYNKIMENIDINYKVDSYVNSDIQHHDYMYGVSKGEPNIDTIYPMISKADQGKLNDLQNSGLDPDTIIPTVGFLDGGIPGSWIDGEIPVDKIPASVLERMFVADNEDAMEKLTIKDVQNGDTVKNNATGVMYIVKDQSKLGTMDAFEEYKAGTAVRAQVADSVKWQNVEGRPGNATSSTSGLMSSADKARLDGIKFGYQEKANEKKYKIVQDKDGNLYVSVPWKWQQNTATDDGYVTKGGTSNKNKVWKTDDNGVPGWRTDANTTYGDATSSTKGIVSVGGRLSVSNGKISANWQVFGGQEEPGTRTDRKHCIYVKY